MTNLNITQRDLKRANARRRLQLMAVVLNKNGNAASVRLRHALRGLPVFSCSALCFFDLTR
ncbi:hypothetical protein [Sessilibacter corallicola]|uniref:hypothetical protein n=1 Tax=Sessilibacter corallicola TaxID=2904075 RepID=UPI001E2C845C|nr:hypothetical protein [Sessilibacter corallicola]MCE2026729.1 hypothetical protein [Sessilibacter corallicola]